MKKALQCCYYITRCRKCLNSMRKGWNSTAIKACAKQLNHALSPPPPFRVWEQGYMDSYCNISWLLMTTYLQLQPCPQQHNENGVPGLQWWHKFHSWEFSDESLFLRLKPLHLCFCPALGYRKPRFTATAMMWGIIHDYKTTGQNFQQQFWSKPNPQDVLQSSHHADHLYLYRVKCKWWWEGFLWTVNFWLYRVL